MRRATRPLALLTALVLMPFAAASAFAFEVQSGGLPLSAQNVAMLANRLAARAERAAPETATERGGEAMRLGALTKEDRMMRFMLGERPDARSASAARTPAEALAGGNPALRNRR